MNTTLISHPHNTAGVILAGGRATRMGHQDKGLVNYHGQPLIYYAIGALRPAVAQVIINANRNIADYRHFGHLIVSDHTDSFDGPLAGVLAVMGATHADILLVMPCDCPLIKTRHIQKLLLALNETHADIAVAYDGKQRHNVFFAVRTSLQQGLQAYLASGQHKVGTWQNLHHLIPVDFSHEPEIFTNINTMHELSRLEGDTQPGKGNNAAQ
jgi:molybdopterin-guanine dinucleotide biosynthesis protein A